MSKIPTTTLNGKFDARCVSCGCVAYRLWVDDMPPPGCPEGHDDDITKCPNVYTKLVAVVIWQDHTHPGEPLHPYHQDLMDRLGDRAAPLLAHIRSGKPALEYDPKPVNYDLARPQ